MRSAAAPIFAGSTSFPAAHAIGERDELGLHPDEELLASAVVACLPLG